MKKNSESFKHIPGEVMWVWALQFSCQHVGAETYKKMYDIINRNPKYFEWEHRYKNIPKEVHEAYLDELFPDRHKPIRFESDEVFDGYIPQIMKQSQPTDVKPITQQDINDLFNSLNSQSLIEKKERLRRMEIWDKHYKKYNLKFRE